MVTSELLLEEFARTRSEDAFRQIVERHLNLVFATALRIAQGDTHLARDIAQVVFRDLALKAGQLPRGTLLSGWLYRHSTFTAAKMLRTERRRVAREQSSLDYQSMSAPDDFGERLDPALEKLAEEDRTVIVLRFLEALNFRQIGEALGISEDAAQKRVSRALDKLRPLLARHGVTLTTTGLAAALAAQTISAPLGLSGILTRSVLENLVLSPASPMTTLIGTVQSKMALLTLVTFGLGIPLLFQQHQINGLAAEREALAKTAGELRDQLAASPKAIPQAELDRLRHDTAELHKLRAEIGPLKERLRRLESSATGVGTANAATELVQNAPPPQVVITTLYAEMSSVVINELQTLGINPPTASEVNVLTSEKARSLEDFLKQREGVDLLSAPNVVTLDRRQARVAVEDTLVIEGNPFQVGTALDVIPEVSLDRESINLKISGTYREYLGVLGTDGLPRFRVRQMQGEGRLHDSDTLLLEALSPGDPSGPPRRLLVLVSSTIINPDGSRAVRTTQ